MHCLNKLHFSDGRNIDWYGLVASGVPVLCDDNWIVSKKSRYPVFNNYVGIRLVKNEKGTIYKVVCTTFESTCKLPIFKCLCYLYDSGKEKFEDDYCFSLSLTKITPLVSKVLKRLNVNTKKHWPGFEFFGYHLKSVRFVLDQCISDKEIYVRNPSTQVCEFGGPESLIETNGHNSVMFTHSYNWLGVLDYGKMTGECTWERQINNTKICIPSGYVSKIGLKVSSGDTFTQHEIHCAVSGAGSVPQFTCSTDNKFFTSHCPTSAMKQVFSYVGYLTERKMSGYEFFGFYRREVIQKLSVKQSSATMNQVLLDIANIQKRNGGPTSKMSSNRNKILRNEKIYRVVELSSFGDTRSFIQYLIKKFPEIVLQCLKENDFETFCSLRQSSTNLDEKDSSLLLMSYTSLTQREYNNIRQVLKKHYVFLAPYTKVSDYIKSLNIGSLETKFCSCASDCMSCGSDLKETLEHVIMSETWFQKMIFHADLSKLMSELNVISHDLYGNLDPSIKTLFIRMTGDNFRTASRHHTEQISYSILNCPDLLNSPYGQILSSLWRGKETRQNLQQHTLWYHSQVYDLLLNGAHFTLPSGNVEKFNVIPIVCADLGFIKELLGKCSSTGTYGCYYCKKPKKKWAEKKMIPEQWQTMKEMSVAGSKARDVLGDSPDHNSKIFTEFQQTHYGQHGVPLFNGFEMICMPPCGLHLILAIHRYLWGLMHSVLTERKQISSVKDAFINIGCGHLALQYEAYFVAKGKCYDGSATLKMVGKDCKELEKSIDKFVAFFLKEHELISHKSCESLRHIVDLYRLFIDLAHDIRNINVEQQRIDSFDMRAEKFFCRFKSYGLTSMVSAKPYLHILREHIGTFMCFWSNHLGWGYGVFNCNGGEHLNKRIKCMEFGETNLKSDRFAKIMRNMRVKQLYYPDNLFTKGNEISCSACHEVGHNKKNKHCPMHPENIHLEFSDSDSDD